MADSASGSRTCSRSDMTWRTGRPRGALAASLHQTVSSLRAIFKNNSLGAAACPSLSDFHNPAVGCWRLSILNLNDGVEQALSEFSDRAIVNLEACVFI